jgi:hypothetical protein
MRRAKATFLILLAWASHGRVYANETCKGNNLILLAWASHGRVYPNETRKLRQQQQIWFIGWTSRDTQTANHLLLQKHKNWWLWVLAFIATIQAFDGIVVWTSFCRNSLNYKLLILWNCEWLIKSAMFYLMEQFTSRGRAQPYLDSLHLFD